LASQSAARDRQEHLTLHLLYNYLFGLLGNDQVTTHTQSRDITARVKAGTDARCNEAERYPGISARRPDRDSRMDFAVFRFAKIPSNS